MTKPLNLPTAYDASQVEDRVYEREEASGAFNPDSLPGDRKELYTIVLPPPNRTGTLHMGHAAMLAIEDVMIRFERMRGKKTLWIPGTDHAAIATQVKVEQKLIAEGLIDPRKELGREEFLKRVVAFAEESAQTINAQIRKMGASVDWSRERYTLDDERNHAVNRIFEMMVEDGIIERGSRLVNWDPQFQTTLSDDEVLTKEVTTKLYTFTYDKDFPIAIATTRPETKFGDVAVAVHPSDGRYVSLIGKTFTPTFCGKKLSIQIIADEAVDPEFGTGALGVTPAHSLIDAEMAERHGLETIAVIGKDGCLLSDHSVPHELAHATITNAREWIADKLTQEGVLISVEDVTQNLPIAERGGTPVEQLPMRQWFVRVTKPFALRQDTLGKWKQGDVVTLKELMLYAMESEQITMIPEWFKKIYFHWVQNLRDWCISRQIWFGHRIPVWYRGDEWRVGETSPGLDWEQDPDTLDTWFSSGMWTFSALGWPNQAEWKKYRAYHPTAVLETGYDILFFWVARMILMSTYALGEVPFRDVYLHGLIRDEQGRKMSKSLGNILNPLELIPKYGTDAVRLSLLIGSTPGADVKLSEEKIAGFRNFTNKLWNISRYMLLTIGQEKTDSGHAPDHTLADRWILARLSATVANVTQKLGTHQFSSAGEELRDFTWNDLADWYLEVAKVEKGKEKILAMILQTMLKLWHPFMPFVTEHLWEIAKFEGLLIVADWPSKSFAEAGMTESVEKKKLEGIGFESLRTLISDIRRLRQENNIEPAKKISCVVQSCEMNALFEENNTIITTLARLASFTITDLIPETWASTNSGRTIVAIDVAGSIDVVKEKEKATDELVNLQQYIVSTQEKLANTEFISKAPANVVASMQAKLEEANAKKESLLDKLKRLF